MEDAESKNETSENTTASATSTTSSSKEKGIVVAAAAGDEKAQEGGDDKEDEEEIDEEEELYQGIAVLGLACIAMGEDIGQDMSLRHFGHLMHYGNSLIRRAVPLAMD